VTNVQLTYLRTGATALITVLTALLVIYPHEMWTPVIAAAIAAGSAIGIHAIPAVSQITSKGIIMPVTPPPLTGAELMGLTRPVQPVVPADPPGTVYVRNADGTYTAQSQQDTDTYKSATGETPSTPEGALYVAPEDETTVTPVDVNVADLIDNVVAGLEKISAMIRTQAV